MILNLSDIRLLRDISPQELDIKNKSRSNLLPWKGQFAPELIEILLKRFAREGYSVLDPFVGSGTTLYESARLGIEALGVELNPAAYVMSKLYSLSNLPSDKRKDLLTDIQRIVYDILYRTSPKDIPLKMISIYKEVSGIEKIVIGAWIVLTDFNLKHIRRNLLKSWGRLYALVNKLPYTDKTIDVLLADARKIPIDDNRFDLLITSPPYINVINYHQQHRKSTELLGYPILDIAKSEIGSNRKNRSNRFLTVIQYCIDMALVIKEIQRLCVDGASVIIVIGRESKIKNISISNTEILASLSLHIELDIVGRYERKYKNRYGQNIIEDIIVLRNVKKYHGNEYSYEDIGRNIAVSYLGNIVHKVIERETRRLIESAINGAENVQKSPLMEDIHVST